MMCLYSVLLLVLNRRGLPEAIRVRSYRAAALVWSAGFFGISRQPDDLAAVAAAGCDSCGQLAARRLAARGVGDPRSREPLEPREG